jgi:hypothetical protein
VREHLQSPTVYTGFGVNAGLCWGGSCVPDIYPQFPGFYTNFFVNEAHDDNLQLLVEMGGLGFVTMLWFVIAMYRGAVKKLGNRPEDINGTVALATMLGATASLLTGGGCPRFWLEVLACPKVPRRLSEGESVRAEM